MIGLETERLQFRHWTNADHPSVANFYNDENNAKYVGGVKTSEEAWRIIATYLGHFHLKGYSYLAITEKESDHLIGTVGLWKSPAWPEHEMGYWLLPEFQGKGYGLEAATAVKQYASEQDEFTTLVSYIDSNNRPSINLANKLGAQFDKTIELMHHGPHDVYRYW